MSKRWSSVTHFQFSLNCNKAHQLFIFTLHFSFTFEHHICYYTQPSSTVEPVQLCSLCAVMCATAGAEFLSSAGPGGLVTFHIRPLMSAVGKLWPVRHIWLLVFGLFSQCRSGRFMKVGRILREFIWICSVMPGFSDLVVHSPYFQALIKRR